MQKKNKISALIITYNEIGYIENCIKSIEFADEIVVVDSYSNDGTYEYLCNHPKVKVLQKPFENFTKQKSYALAQASNDWVLFLDADEVIPDTLQAEIKNVINSNDDDVAYWCYKKFMFKTKPLHFCGWRSDKNYRLFRKSKVRFSSKRIVHETLEVDGSSGILKEKLIHFSYKSFQDYKSKMRSYGRFKAKEAIILQKRFRYSSLILKPLYIFTYHFIIRFGFLDAKKGLIISYLSALGEIERYTELKRLQYQYEQKSSFSYEPVKPILDSTKKIFQKPMLHN